MATESNNTKGNKWHSSEDGKFISGPKGESINVDDLTLADFGLSENFDINALGQMVELEPEELTLDDFDINDELTLDDFDVFNDSEDNFDDALNMSSEQYDLIYNQGRKIPAFDNFNDVLNNIEQFFDDEMIENHIANAKISHSNGGTVYAKNTKLTTGFAFDFFTKARSASTHFKGITDEEFNEKLGTMPQSIPAIKNWNQVISYDSTTESDVQQMCDVFLKGGQTAYIPLFHGISGIQSHRDFKTILAQYKSGVKDAADTVLIGNGCYDYACYCALSKGYSYGSYSGGHDGTLIRLLAPIDKNTRVCFDDVNGCMDLNNVPKTWRKKSEILKEYKLILPNLQAKVKNILQSNGVSDIIINTFLNSMETGRNSNNRSVPLVLMGYDFDLGYDQMDVLNPSRILMNIDKYRSDDD